MLSGSFVPQDQDVRRRIQEALEENFFVEAGAGTGKTSSLVDRIVALVASGRASLDQVAAITFTESAASELRDRIRESLERAAADPERPIEEQARCTQGVADLDRAAIQTLHSFAGSLLRERPLEAGLPPAFEALDQISADMGFREAWGTWLDNALDDSGLRPSLRIALSLGLTLGHLQQVAASFHGNYDLLEDASFPEQPPSRPHAAAALIAESHELERLCAFAKNDADPLEAYERLILDVLRGENDSATSTDTITVTPQDGGSEITYEAVIEAKGVGKLAEPLMKLVFERIGSETEKKMTEVLDRLAG